ncbi:MAG: tetraacyldisaccharide 4'-kinase [Candidatus Marinimicrobia bacterium]|nr:tetraacyldisaccharide 4'-kinase [Candidatus Neomarinimicrobiota bacterium]
MLRLIKYIIFIPIALLYRIVITIRYFLYRNGFKKAVKFKTPIISVGNITVGGTGKTPMVYYLVKELQKKYPKISILSRGYGRKTKGFHLVNDGNKLLSSPRNSGDEPFLLANKLGNCIVAVDENRVRGIKNLEEEFKPDLVILDDGFQQLGIHKTIDIVLLNASKSFSEFKVLPIGNGREPISKLKRADILIYTKTKNFQKPKWSSEINIDCPTFNSKYDAEVWEYKDNNYQKIYDLPKNLFAFCGIADPNSFQQVLDKNCISLSGLKVFKDHEPYSKKNIKQLSKEISNKKTKNVITTEKDIVKLPEFFLKNHHIFTIRINHIFEDKNLFINKINSIIKEKK